MDTIPSGPSGPSGSSAGRATLDRDRIVSTAVTFIDSDGVSALSMRRLGALMGVEAMSLYRYVASREALLDAVVDAVMLELKNDPEVRLTPDDGWEDFVTRLAHGIRRMALAHPRAFSLVASRPTVAPFVRPPLRTLDWVEIFLGGLVHEGFGPQAAVTAYQRFSSWLLGHLLLEVGPPDPAEVHGVVRSHGSLTAYPHVHALNPQLAAGHDAADAEFTHAVNHLVDRLGQLRAS